MDVNTPQNNQVFRLLLKLAFLFPVILVVAGINFLEDPANLFHEEVAYARAIAMLEGLNFEISGANHDERIAQKAYIQGLQEANDVIVLGSSRVLNLRSGNFQDQRFHNNGVSSATLEDFAAILALYKEADKLPNTVVIGLDPWLLRRDQALSEWKSLAKEYCDFLSSMRAEENCNIVGLTRENNIHKLRKFFSPAYFKISLSVFLRSLFESDLSFARATVNQQSDYFMWLSDGSIVYSVEKRSVTEEEVQEMIRKGILAADGFYQVGFDIASEKLLDDILLFTEREGIEVIFLLPPYPPLTYQYFAQSDEYGVVLEVETYYRHLASDRGIAVLGSYDPNLVGCTESEFFDAVHPKPECINRIFADWQAGN